MVNVKAKDVKDWKVWHYGVLVSLSCIFCDGMQIEIVPRTICRNTGLKCKGEAVYENDWLEVQGDGSIHNLLVEWRDNAYRACENENISYNIHNVLANKTCKIAGNLYD
jgi:hypothetical protein